MTTASTCLVRLASLSRVATLARLASVADNAAAESLPVPDIDNASEMARRDSTLERAWLASLAYDVASVRLAIYVAGIVARQRRALEREWRADDRFFQSLGL